MNFQAKQCEAIYNKIVDLYKEEKSKGDSIRLMVLTDALEKVNPISYLKDVISYGCISGIVNSLVYYNDTHKFFDNRYHEIEVIRSEWEAKTGQSISIIDDLKNDLAWFAYEQTAQSILDELI